MKATTSLLLMSLLSAWIVGCSPKVSESPPVLPKGLDDFYAEDFHIGAAINRTQINQADSLAAQLLEREFSSITPENMMKWMHIHPGPDSFNFEMADRFIELGESQNKFTVGHTLIWHSQLAPWVESLEGEGAWQAAFDNHIQKIARRYAGKIDAWDVVNEALNEDGSLRESVFLQNMGEAYLIRAFNQAAAADPQAELYYNDYNLCQEKKREGAIALIRKLQEAGCKIDGVGIQAHWSLHGPSVEEIEESILAYAALGIKVMFTELDVTVLPNPWDLEGAEVSQNYEGSPFMNPYPEALPDSVQTALADRYEEIFRLFLKHKDKISRVTFWGIHDGQSWLNGWPIKGRTNYPLIFDRTYQAKQAYDRIKNLKSASGSMD